MEWSPEWARLSYRAIEGTYTKTRRLAYLTAILNRLKNDGVGERPLLTRLTRWNQKHREALQRYWAHTGEVSSTRRNSAGARYVHLATQSGLIVSVAGAYRVTRRGRVVLALLEYHRLGQKIAGSPDERLRQELLQRQTEVQGWKQPKRYAEHLVPPRLNWLLDLGFLDPDRFRTHHYELTLAGRQFLTTLLHPRNEGFSDVTDEWLSSTFWEVAVETLLDLSSLLEWDAVDEAFLRSVLGDLLSDTFQAFRHTFVPKVTLTQAFVYVSCRLILEHRIRASPTRLRRWFASPQILNGRRYEVRFSPRENESYLLATTV
ncbi:MAG: hypothetical protein Q9O62_04395 [Ardenticatenia bacterium]|nr:hypothetical protein [Ardenticatenia bacterium]